MIGKYEWGKEYPINEQMPKGLDNIEVEQYWEGEWYGESKLSSKWRSWDGVTAFRITDQRHKPADTSYLKKVSEAERFGIMPPMNINERCDLNNWRWREELPPVGCDDFEWSMNGKCWEHGLMLFNDGVTCLIANKKYPANRHHLKSFDPDLRFRPIRTEREKVIEAAEKAMLTSRVSNTQRKTIKRLYDLGMLVLPPKKRDTKD